MKKKILDLISQTGHHPSFTLPPVSLFLSKLKEILAEPEDKLEILVNYGPYNKDDPRSHRGF